MDAVAAIARTSFSLVAVLGLVYLISRWLRRRTGAGAGGAGEFAVLARQSLGAKASVALVRVGERALVVGVSEQGVSLLGETDVATVLPEHAPAVVPAVTPAVVPAVTPAVVPAVITVPDDAAPGTAAPRPVPGAGERYVRRAGERVETSLPSPALTPSPTTGFPATGSAVSGSALSPATWTKAVDVLRERTTRR